MANITFDILKIVVRTMAVALLLHPMAFTW